MKLPAGTDLCPFCHAFTVQGAPCTSCGAPPAARKTKYRNQPQVVQGIWFQSKKEGRRYSELKLMESAGAIQDLRRQVKYELFVNDVRVGSYRADFWYLENGQVVVEDVKSPATRKLEAYRLKRALMLALHGITIREC